MEVPNHLPKLRVLKCVAVLVEELNDLIPRVLPAVTGMQLLTEPFVRLVESGLRLVGPALVCECFSLRNVFRGKADSSASIVASFVNSRASVLTCTTAFRLKRSFDFANAWRNIST